MTSESLLVTERDGDVLTMVLNRPKAMNALNSELMSAIEAWARSLIDDPARVVIIRGAGKHFCAGADLKPSARPKPALVQARRDAQLGGRMLRALADIPQVTIAAVHGAALGGGLCIPTACDFRVAAEDALGGYPEVNLGMNLMWHSVGYCLRLVGPAKAKRMIMLGERFDAETLKDWGLWDEVVPRADLERRSLALAESYAAQPPIAVQMIKETINQVSGALDRAILHMDADQNLLTAGSQDRQRAIAAFQSGEVVDYRGD
ncbi:MAG: enoyl-CoA hydratase/isomerase family protein [Pseudomonadales bacterium]